MSQLLFIEEQHEERGVYRLKWHRNMELMKKYPKLFQWLFLLIVFFAHISWLVNGYIIDKSAQTRVEK